VAGSSDGDFALARYTSSGVLDPSFSRDGRVTTDFGSSENDGAYDVAVQSSDGRIVAAGRGGANLDFALARYTTGGVLDLSFSGDGKVKTDFGSSADQAHGLAIQRNGRIVATGLGATAMTVARDTTVGALDTSLSGDGKVTIDFGDPAAATGVAIQPSNGRIVAAGIVSRFTDADFAVARYLEA